MTRTVPATQVKNRFGEIIKQVYVTGEHIVVAKDGLPVVVIIPITQHRQNSSGIDLENVTVAARESANKSGPNNPMVPSEPSKAPRRDV